jgi:hypothetical protein
VIPTGHCIGFSISCGTIVKGALDVLMGFTLFIGSILLLLSAVFGRRMGYLVLAVSFFSWMIILSTIWLTGLFISQGPTTVKNLGPRGAEPGWVVESAGTAPQPVYSQYTAYPGSGPWRVPGKNDTEQASLQAVQTAVQNFLAQQANERAHINPFAAGAFLTTDFSVDDVQFAPVGGVSLAAARAFYNGGGPEVTVFLRHDSGSVPRYSIMFLAGSILGLGVHLPFLDRAERKRKDILTGGTAPPWYGPA